MNGIRDNYKVKSTYQRHINLRTKIGDENDENHTDLKTRTAKRSGDLMKTLVPMKKREESLNNSKDINTRVRGGPTQRPANQKALKKGEVGKEVSPQESREPSEDKDAKGGIKDAKGVKDVKGAKDVKKKK